MNMDKFKENVKNYLFQTLSRDYGLSSVQIEQLIKDSEIEKSIDLYPETMGHMNPDQLLDFVLEQ